MKKVILKTEGKKYRVSIPLVEWIVYWAAVVVFMMFIAMTIGTVMLRSGSTQPENAMSFEARLDALEAKVQALEKR